MRTASLRLSVMPFVLIFTLALAGCGTGGHACPAISSDCGCGLSPASVACPIAPSEFLLATTASGQILTFPVDFTTGALGASTSTSGANLSLGLAAGVDDGGMGVVYTSDFHNMQIDGLSINSNNGSLSPLSGSPFSTGDFSVPAGLALSLQASFLYAADAGTIDAYSINNAGMLTALPDSPFASGTNLQLLATPSGKFLFATDDDPPNGVFAFTIDATGALTSVVGSPFPIPGQTVLNSQPLGLATDATGQFLYVAVNKTDQIAAYSIDQTTGALTNVPGSPFPAGSGPTFVTVANGFLYAVNSVEQSLSAYAINSTSGVLTPVAGSPFAVGATAGLATDASGTHLYAAGPASNGIFAFTINADGTLTPINGSPFPALGAALLATVEIL
jgi:6-phosphogluconolactonase